MEGIFRSSRWLGQGLGEVAVVSVRAFRRPAGAAGPAPASRREGRDLRMTPVPAGRCGEGRGRKDARSAVLQGWCVAVLRPEEGGGEGQVAALEARRHLTQWPNVGGDGTSNKKKNLLWA